MLLQHRQRRPRAPEPGALSEKAAWRPVGESNPAEQATSGQSGPSLTRFHRTIEYVLLSRPPPSTPQSQFSGTASGGFRGEEPVSGERPPPPAQPLISRAPHWDQLTGGSGISLVNRHGSHSTLGHLTTTQQQQQQTCYHQLMCRTESIKSSVLSNKPSGSITSYRNIDLNFKCDANYSMRIFILPPVAI